MRDIGPVMCTYKDTERFQPIVEELSEPRRDAFYLALRQVVEGRITSDKAMNKAFAALAES